MKRKLGEILVAAGAVTQEELDLALTDQHAGDPGRVGELLVAMGKITPQQLARALSAHHTVPYVELPPIPPPVLELVPLNFQRQHRLVPFRLDGDRLSVAVAEPSDSEAIRELRVLVGTETKVVLFVAPIDEIEAVHSSMGEDVDLALDAAVTSEEGGVASSPSKLEELFGDLDLPVSEPTTIPAADAAELFGDPDTQLEPDPETEAPPPADLFAPPPEPDPVTQTALPEDLFAPPPPASTFEDPLFGPVPDAAPLFAPPPEPEDVVIAEEEAPPPDAETVDVSVDDAGPAPTDELVSFDEPVEEPVSEPADGPALAAEFELDRAPEEHAAERIEDMPFDPGVEAPAQHLVPSSPVPVAAPPPPPAEEVTEFESAPTVHSPAAAAEPEWTGKLEDVQPSRLIVAVAKALVMRGLILEQDVLDALAKK